MEAAHAHSEPAQGTPCPILITSKAIAVMKNEMVKADLQGYALRVAVIGGGCSGYQYDLDFSQDIRPGDIVSELEGLKVVVDEKSSLYLQGTQIDYVDEIGVAGFKFLNPNAQKSCGCGTSFNV
jgi:iron-sulfur cluster assembly accessory protein